MTSEVRSRSIGNTTQRSKQAGRCENARPKDQNTRSFIIPLRFLLFRNPHELSLSRSFHFHRSQISNQKARKKPSRVPQGALTCATSSARICLHTLDRPTLPSDTSSTASRSQRSPSVELVREHRPRELNLCSSSPGPPVSFDYDSDIELVSPSTSRTNKTCYPKSSASFSSLTEPIPSQTTQHPYPPSPQAGQLLDPMPVTRAASEKKSCRSTRNSQPQEPERSSAPSKSPTAAQGHSQSIHQPVSPVLTTPSRLVRSSSHVATSSNRSPNASAGQGNTSRRRPKQPTESSTLVISNGKATAKNTLSPHPSTSQLPLPDSPSPSTARTNSVRRSSRADSPKKSSRQHKQDQDRFSHSQVPPTPSLKRKHPSALLSSGSPHRRSFSVEIESPKYTYRSKPRPRTGRLEPPIEEPSPTAMVHSNQAPSEASPRDKRKVASSELTEPPRKRRIRKSSCEASPTIQSSSRESPRSSTNEEEPRDSVDTNATSPPPHQEQSKPAPVVKVQRLPGESAMDWMARMIEAKKAAAKPIEQDDLIPDSEGSDEEEALPEMNQVDAEAAARPKKKRRSLTPMEEQDPETVRQIREQALKHLEAFETAAEIRKGGKDLNMKSFIRQQNQRRANGWKTTAEINADIKRYQEEEELADLRNLEGHKMKKLSKEEQEALREKINSMDTDAETKRSLLHSSGLDNPVEIEKDEFLEKEKVQRQAWTENSSRSLPVSHPFEAAFCEANADLSLYSVLFPSHFQKMLHRLFACIMTFFWVHTH